MKGSAWFRREGLGEAIAQDVRFGLRSLYKNPGFTIAAIVTIALGIGSSTAVFSVVNGVLLRPLPFDEPDRLVMLEESIPASNRFGLSSRPAIPIVLPGMVMVVEPPCELLRPSQRPVTIASAIQTYMTSFQT